MNETIICTDFVADNLQLFMFTMFLGSDGLFQQDNATTYGASL